MEAYHWINGVALDGGERMSVQNPSHVGDGVGTVPLGGTDEIGMAVEAARRAQPAWQRLGGMARGNVLFRAAQLVEEHLEELATLACREMGKPISEARGEAQRAVAILRYYGGEGGRSIGDVIPAASPGTLQYTTRRPLGVVGIITPWNFPLAIPMWKVAPALVYGNTVVLKPAEWSSLTAYRLFSLVAPLFPEGVLNVVMGRGTEAGDALVNHLGIHGLSFTGSEGVGSAILQRGAQRGIKVQCEMGGKNPVIVARDADIAWAVQTTVSGAMRSAGQKCTATSRVIVEEAIVDRFTQELTSAVERLPWGDAQDPVNYLGPVVSERQQAKVLQMIERGLHEGARLLTGGPERSGRDGWYVAPTVLTGVEPMTTIAQEEIFGPVVAILPVPTIDRAIEVANAVKYGLSASVFTQDLPTALYCVERLEAGMVRVNEETAGVEYQAPFGGLKASSSHSREQGRAAIDFYTDVQTIAIRGGAYEH